MNRKWSKEELNYLEEQWGSKPVKLIAKSLNRSVSAVISKKRHLGLGSFLENGDYITLNCLRKILGYCHSSYRVEMWIRNGLPVKHKKVINSKFSIILVKDFWEWAEKHKGMIDFSNLEENVLGIEPEWVKIKRRDDFYKYNTAPWTATEEQKLYYLLGKRKYSYGELAEEMNRSCGAIQRKIKDMGWDLKPIKAYNRNWTEEEIEILNQGILKGLGYRTIANEIKRSEKAIRGIVYRLWRTENLDKARERISGKK